MFKVFNSVLKGAQSLPVTTLVQLTFFWINSYFLAKNEQGYTILASDKQYTPYVDAKIKARVVKGGSFEILLYGHNQGRFHASQREVEHIASTYITIKALVVRHLYMDFHIIRL